MSPSWTARFIAALARPTGQGPAPAPYLRREFTVGPGLRSATLHVTALGLVEAHLNGSQVGGSPRTPEARCFGLAQHRTVPYLETRRSHDG